MGKRILKALGRVTVVLLGLAVIVWLVWIPSAREPGYVFVAAWGEPGNAPGQFHDPTGIAVTDNEVFVSDARNARIQVFGLDIFGPFNGWFATVTGIAIDYSGNVFVADFYNNRVQKLLPDGTFLSTFGRKGSGPGQFEKAIAVAVARDGTVFVADFANNRIQKWKPKS